jgi:cell wall-associated NlpC family hydrolase
VHEEFHPPGVAGPTGDQRLQVNRKPNDSAPGIAISCPGARSRRFAHASSFPVRSQECGKFSDSAWLGRSHTLRLGTKIDQDHSNEGLGERMRMSRAISRFLAVLGFATVMVAANYHAAEARGTPAPTPDTGSSARPFWLKPGESSEPASSGARSLAVPAMPPVAPEQALARAATWITANNGGTVPYSQAKCFPDFTSSSAGCVPPKYRTDCSGFVSMAFGLSLSYVTGDMAQSWFSTPITKGELQPGDLMLNATPGDGHVVLFERWADSAHSSYVAYEQSGDGGTHHRTIPYPYFGTYPMSPHRYVNVVGSGSSRGPVALSPSPGVVDVFWKGTDANLYHKWYSGGVWNGPQSLGAGPLGSDPVPVVTGSGVVDVFWKGTDANLYHKWYSGGVWNGPQSLGAGPLGSDPVPVSPSPGVVDVFWKGTDANLYHKWYSGGVWNGPQNLGGSIS